MKKAAFIVVLLAIVAGAAFWYVHSKQRGTVGGLPRTPTATQPFALDFEVNEQNLAFYLDGDTTGSVFGSSPFYFGKRPLPYPQGLEYEKARVAKVDEIVGLADDVLKGIDDNDAKRKAVKKALFDYLQVIVKEEPKAEKDVAALVKRVIGWEAKQIVSQAASKAFAARKSNDAFAQSMFRYLAVVKAVDASEAFFKGSVDMANAAAVYVNSTLTGANAKIAEAAKGLDSAMGQFDDLKTGLTQVAAGAVAIRTGFAQLSAGDFHYAKAAMSYLAQEIPNLKKQLAAVKPNKSVTAELIAATKAQLAYLNSLQKAMNKVLAQVDESKLAQADPAELMPFATPAYAYSVNDYTKGYQTLVTPATTDSSWTLSGALKTGWSGIKTAVHGVQTGAGFILDSAGAAVKIITRTGYSGYVAVTTPTLYWDKQRNGRGGRIELIKSVAGDLWQDVKGDCRGVIDNFNNSTSGSQILIDTKANFDAGEEYIDEHVSKAVEDNYGKGTLSWAAGKVAKLGAGILTGLGKGIALIGNRQATAGDYVVGALELGSVALGGSKVFVRGTQIPGLTQGFAEGGWLSAQRVFNSFRSWSMGAFKEDMAIGAKNLEANIAKALAAGDEAGAAALRNQLREVTLEAASFEAVKVGIRESNAEIAKALAALIDAGARAGVANAGKTLRESLTEVAETILRRNLQHAGEEAAANAAEGLGATALAKFKKTFDEFFGEGLDEMVKTAVDEALNAAPKAVELSGKWTGQATCTEIVLPPAPPAGKKDDCNLDMRSAIMKLKGKSFGLVLNANMNPAGSGSGTLTLTYQGKPTPMQVSLKYADGAVSGSGSQKEASIWVSGKAAREEKGYEMDGVLKFSGIGKGAGVRIDFSFKLKK